MRASLKSARIERRIALAGLKGRVSVEGVQTLRAKLSVLGGLAGLLLGALFSNELAVLAAATGAIAGALITERSLTEESARRSKELERDLPEMLEVVALGLRSGLSFERSFELYCCHFEGQLSRAASSARRQWTLGLATREEALKAMAAGYDSKLLARLVESVVRSLRFGSSLADELEALAEEAREARKSRLQEEIAKAPVKMMIPTGTLILPAMLLLVLGPVLLELMEGF